VDVYIKGPGSGREAAIRSHTAGLQLIQWVTPILIFAVDLQREEEFIFRSLINKIYWFSMQITEENDKSYFWKAKVFTENVQLKRDLIHCNMVYTQK
jgi:hypothetical protein